MRFTTNAFVRHSTSIASGEWIGRRWISALLCRVLDVCCSLSIEWAIVKIQKQLANHSKTFETSVSHRTMGQPPRLLKLW